MKGDNSCLERRWPGPRLGSLCGQVAPGLCVPSGALRARPGAVRSAVLGAGLGAVESVVEGVMVGAVESTLLPPMSIESHTGSSRGNLFVTFERVGVGRCRELGSTRTGLQQGRKIRRHSEPVSLREEKACATPRFRRASTRCRLSHPDISAYGEPARTRRRVNGHSPGARSHPSEPEFRSLRSCREPRRDSSATRSTSIDLDCKRPIHTQLQTGKLVEARQALGSSHR